MNGQHPGNLLPLQIELLVWHSAVDTKPDADIEVQVYCERDGEGGIYPGAFNDEAQLWFDALSREALPNVKLWSEGPFPMAGEGALVDIELVERMRRYGLQADMHIADPDALRFLINHFLELGLAAHQTHLDQGQDLFPAGCS